MTVPPRAMHPERTADPTMLRWVVHHSALADAAPGRRDIPAGSRFAALQGAGEVVEIAVAAGDVLVRVGDARRWPSLAGAVRSALTAELDALDHDRTHWLLVSSGSGSVPSVGEVQAVVDRAAGDVMALHGGRLEVVEVGAGRVVLLAHGACHGCGSSATTLLDRVAPAVRAASPQLVDIVIDDPAADDAPAPVSRPRRRFRRSDGSCH